MGTILCHNILRSLKEMPLDTHDTLEETKHKVVQDQAWMQNKIAEEFYERWAKKLGIPLQLFRIIGTPEPIQFDIPSQMKKDLEMFEREFSCKFIVSDETLNSKAFD